MSEIESRDLSEQPTLVMRTKATVEGIPEFLGRAYGAAAAHAHVSGVEIVGPPFARYEMLNGPESGFSIEAGFPVSSAVDGSGVVEASALPDGRVDATWHIGPYDTMQPTYAAIVAWIEEVPLRAAPRGRSITQIPRPDQIRRHGEPRSSGRTVRVRSSTIHHQEEGAAYAAPSRLEPQDCGALLSTRDPTSVRCARSARA